jgi:hypothetical protein
MSRNGRWTAVSDDDERRLRTQEAHTQDIRIGFGIRCERIRSLMPIFSDTRRKWKPGVHRRELNAYSCC